MKKRLFPRTGALFGRVPFSRLNTQNKQLTIQRIVILGDSVAYGYGTRGGIAKYLKETFTKSDVKNLGINGLTSTGLVERLRTGTWDDDIRSADLVLLNIGGNDLLRAFRRGGPKGLLKEFGSLKKTYRQNLLEVYRTIRELNEDILIVQNNLYNSMTKESQYFGFTNLLFKLWNTAIGEKGVVVSRTDAMGKNRAIWLDSIHPNEEGYRIMHDLLVRTLTSTGYLAQRNEK